MAKVSKRMLNAMKNGASKESVLKSVASKEARQSVAQTLGRTVEPGLGPRRMVTTPGPVTSPRIPNGNPVISDVTRTKYGRPRKAKSGNFRTASQKRFDDKIETGRNMYKNMTPEDKAVWKSIKRNEQKKGRVGRSGNDKIRESIGGPKAESEWKAAGNVRKQVKEKQQVINQLVEGGAPQPKPTAPTSIKNVANGMWGNIKDVGFAQGDYLGSALTGAVVGGTISGTNEWANGGSFTGGFKSGLVSGAIGGTAMKGVKVGAYGKNYAKHSLTDATGNIAKGFYKEQLAGKSKALSALETLRNTSSKHPTMG